MGNNILITGGTGLIGKELMDLLMESGYNVAVLSRRKGIEGVKSFYWDYEAEVLDEDAIEFADVIIHLAGEGIANKRWSPEQKQKILDSRVKTTNLLFSKSIKAKNKPKMIISASAVGFYGVENSEKVFTEKDPAGNDFLASTALAWEKSVEKFRSIGIQTTILRIGVVLSKHGGALSRMMMPVKFGFGAALGSGKQYLPWIEVTDLAHMFIFVLENQKTDVIFNAVGPEQISNKEFMKTIARLMKKPFFLPDVPSFVMKLFMGEMAILLLKGNRVSSEKIQATGFEFKYKTLEEVMKSSN